MRRGFSAIELAVVLVIIVVLAVMLLPVLEQGRVQARRTRCLSNVRQVGMAMEMYQSSHHDYWPTARVSVDPDHPAWPDPTGSMAVLYPSYTSKAYLFECPATPDVVRIEAGARDFTNCANFHVSPSGKPMRPQDAGKGAPCPPSYFYDCGGFQTAGVSRHAPTSRVVYGDECVHGYWIDEQGRGHWLGRNNHPTPGGNFLSVDKHVEWLPLRWAGQPWRKGYGAPFVPNYRVRITPPKSTAGRFVVYPDTNVFWDDWEGKRPEADADLAGMMWVGDSWKEF